MYPNSYSYLLFVAIAVCAFWAAPQPARKWLVLGLSLAAYVISEGLHVGIPLAMIAIAWIFNRLMLSGRGGQRTWCAAGVTAIVAILAYFKYRDFAVANLNVLLSVLKVPVLRVEPFRQLPLGISFCAFTAIGFLLDTYQGRIKRESTGNVATFLSFWPTAMAGPILRFRELGAQLNFRRGWETRMLTRGLDRIVWGLVQKNLIANSLEGWVREGFMPQAASVNSSVDNWFLAVAFGLQIYVDFASYSNLAIGVAQLIGVTLPENFRFPYHAKNPADFWSRWHMSLSRWIRDYLFFPLSARFRDAGARYYLSLIGVMALVGLWHGAGWGFVVWGIMHACYLIIYRMWQKFTESRGQAFISTLPVRVFWRAFVLVAAAAAWVPFRADSLQQAARMLHSMFAGFRLGTSYSVNFYLATLLIAAFCAIEPYLSERIVGIDKRWSQQEILRTANPMLIRPLLYAAALFLFVVLDDRDTRFIYFQF